LSRTFPTKEETLEKAERAGLVEHSNDQRLLEDQSKIKPCPADPKPHDDADIDWTPDKPAS
jgi:hypothetical protein